MKTKYMKMPVSKEDKLELNKKGYKVVDIKFAPDGYEEEKPKPKRKPATKKKVSDKA